ncbi:hypothetical protein [Sagittula marina]|nr:hypothetical protein [Sagittula marina]
MSPQNARKERTGDTGPPRFRRKFSAVSEGLSMQCIMNLTQFHTFKYFYTETLQQGSLPFIMPDRVQTGAPVATEGGAILLTEDDFPIAVVRNRLCVFGEPYSANRFSLACDFTVSFTLWDLPT